jgi:hypothetical protein
MKKRNSLYFLFFFFFLIACKNDLPISESKNIDSKVELKKEYGKLVDSCQQFLQNGTIVLRTGNDAISTMFAQLNNTDKTFSHCGIAFEENNIWYVFHSIGGEDNPDEKLRKETFESFVGESHNLGFGICKYNMTEVKQKKLNTIVTDWYQKKMPFDMEFDLKSNDRLYCAEMVFKAFNKTFETDSFFQITNHKGFKYVSTDNIFVNKDAQLLCHLVY